MKAQHFAATFIFRPGLLDRGEKARGVEKVFSKLVSSISVKELARGMIAEAEAGRTGLHMYQGAEIHKAAQADIP